MRVCLLTRECLYYCAGHVCKEEGPHDPTVSLPQCVYSTINRKASSSRFYAFALLRLDPRKIIQRTPYFTGVGFETVGFSKAANKSASLVSSSFEDEGFATMFAALYF